MSDGSVLAVVTGDKKLTIGPQLGFCCGLVDVVKWTTGLQEGNFVVSFVNWNIGPYKGLVKDSDSICEKWVVGLQVSVAVVALNGFLVVGLAFSVNRKLKTGLYDCTDDLVGGVVGWQVCGWK